MDIQGRLKKLLREQGWTRYRLAKESGVPESTLTNIFLSRYYADRGYAGGYLQNLEYYACSIFCGTGYGRNDGRLEGVLRCFYRLVSRKAEKYFSNDENDEIRSAKLLIFLRKKNCGYVERCQTPYKTSYYKIV